jgi:hypothetical protein
VPHELAEIVDRALRKAAAERWRHPAEMAEALRSVAQRLGLPHGADAWGFLEQNLPAPFGAMPLEVVRARASSPPAARARGRATAPERPRTKSGRAFTEPPVAAPATRSARPAEPRARAWLVLAVGLGAPLGAALVLAALGIALRGLPAEAPRPAGANAGAGASGERLGGVPEIEGPPQRHASTPFTQPGPPAQTAEQLEEDALAAFLSGRDDAAIEGYLRATEVAPGRASAWRGLGFAAVARGDDELAERALRRYLAISPSAADRPHVERRLARLGRGGTPSD